MFTPTIYSGIEEAVLSAEAFQCKFNSLSVKRREDITYRFEERLTRLQRKHKLTCQCRDCYAIMDSMTPFGEACVVCGSTDIASEYYC